MEFAPDFTLADLSSALPKEYDMVYLWKHPATLDHYEAHHVPGQAYATFYPQWGTTAYMITPKIARLLLKQIKTLYAPIDDMLIKDIMGSLKTFIMKKDYFTTGTFPSMIFGEV